VSHSTGRIRIRQQEVIAEVVMKSAVSLALVICLVGTSLPAAAQPPTAAHLSNWGRVRTIVPGTRISVGIAGPDEVQQYFLDATDEAITLLDLTNRDVPRDARRTLIRIAEMRPGLFTATRWMEVTDGHVRVNQDGVFVKGHRVAALEDIVRTVDRGDVGEVFRLSRRQPPRTGPRDIALPPEVMAGTVLAASGVAASCHQRCDGAGGFLLMMGALFGPAIVWRMYRDHQRVPEIVYRAP
jgi:hypothetical protein